MSLSEPCCVISRGFHRYYVEVHEVRYTSRPYQRWWKASGVIKPHYEAEVWRGVGVTSRGLMVLSCGDLHFGPSCC